MGYLIRLFTSTSVSSLVPVQAKLVHKSYSVRPAGTNQLDVYYAPTLNPLSIDLTDSNNVATREDIMYFIDQVARLTPDPEDAQGRVLDTLARTRAVIAIGVPDDYDEKAEALNDTIDAVATYAEGLFQVDGEGFYDGNKLILALS